MKKRDPRYPYDEKTGRLKEVKPQPIKDREIVLKNYLDVKLTKYLSEPLAIGFTERFPEKEDAIKDEIVINSTCRNFPVRFRVRYGKVLVGDGKYTCDAITTDRVEIGHKLMLGGFGSFSHVDEAATMEKGIAEMARKHGLMICQKSCSWPFAKAIVQPVEDAHLRHFINENKK